VANFVRETLLPGILAMPLDKACLRGAKGQEHIFERKMERGAAKTWNWLKKDWPISSTISASYGNQV
jgi:hypothetical protein